jgi:hypothetical protein
MPSKLPNPLIMTKKIWKAKIARFPLLSSGGRSGDLGWDFEICFITITVNILWRLLRLSLLRLVSMTKIIKHAGFLEFKYTNICIFSEN